MKDWLPFYLRWPEILCFLWGHEGTFYDHCPRCRACRWTDDAWWPRLAERWKEWRSRHQDTPF